MSFRNDTWNAAQTKRSLGRRGHRDHVLRLARAEREPLLAKVRQNGFIDVIGPANRFLIAHLQSDLADRVCTVPLDRV
jgi:hypothetical protein